MRVHARAHHGQTTYSVEMEAMRKRDII